MALPRPLRRRAASRAARSSALERYRRAVERFRATVDVMPERPVKHELAHLTAPLDAALEDFEDAVADRGRRDRVRDAALLADVQRAATLCAHAVEAALLANQAAWRHSRSDAQQHVATARSLVTRIDELGDAVRRRQ